MSDDPQTTRRSGPERKDKFIPPPMDPYATYQTPYERRPSPEPNPFIEFRRFADKSFSDMLLGIQTMANFPKMFGVEDGMKDLREQLQKDMQEMIALQKASRDDPDYWKKYSDGRNTGGEASELSNLVDSSRSEWQRGTSHGRSNAGTDHGPKRAITSPVDSREWQVDPSTGIAMPKDAATQQPSEAEQEADRRTRWKRGFRNCPELKKFRGETELDMYETYEDLQKPHRLVESAVRQNPSWSSWLPAYGHDGLQRSKKSAEDSPNSMSKQGEESSAAKCDLKRYRAGQTYRMDPFQNDHDFLPWIILSPYSPAYLANSNAAQLSAITAHNGCEAGCAKPVNVQSHKFSNRTINTERDSIRRSRMAEALPWVDAFEDLLAVEKTGQMPNRESSGCTRQKFADHTWIGGLIEKGLLGPSWSLKDGEIMRDARDDPKPRRMEPNGLGFDLSQPEEIVRRLMIDPYFKAAMDQGEALKEMLQQDEKNKNIKPSQQVKAQTQQDVPEPPQPQPTNVANTTPPARPQTRAELESSKPKSSITSTLSTTTSRTLPDGSVETKRILKKRFADGNEESEESTEVVYPQSNRADTGGALAKIQQQQQQQQQPDGEKKQGWFWN